MTNPQLIEQLKRHEGLRLNPYQCTANKLTIGYGRNLEDQGITLQEAQTLLENDIFRVTHELKRGIPLWDEIDSVRQDVLINMAFNLGTRRLLNFKKTLAFIRTKDYASAAKEMLNSKWAKQVGNRAAELSKQMRTGRYS
ncbi:MAG: glycoside hydrolase family protein [Methylomicrobium sp.]|nr:glycoside hydrolase family protein [Methylomicrobium sp.]